MFGMQDLGITLYDSYDAEPEDVFEALPERLYRQFYDLEMVQTCEDSRHWDRTLPSGNILELGCGSGRVTRSLARPDRPGKNNFAVDHAHKAILRLLPTDASTGVRIGHGFP